MSTEACKFQMPIGVQHQNAHTAAGYKKGIFSQDQTTNNRNKKNRFTPTNCICDTTTVKG